MDLDSLQLSISQPKLIFQNEGDLPFCYLISACLLHLGVDLVRVEDDWTLIEESYGSIFNSLLGSFLLLLDKFHLIKKILVCQSFLDERTDQSMFDLVKLANV